VDIFFHSSISERPEQRANPSRCRSSTLVGNLADEVASQMRALESDDQLNFATSRASRPFSDESWFSFFGSNRRPKVLAGAQLLFVKDQSDKEFLGTRAYKCLPPTLPLSPLSHSSSLSAVEEFCDIISNRRRLSQLRKEPVRWRNCWRSLLVIWPAGGSTTLGGFCHWDAERSRSVGVVVPGRGRRWSGGRRRRQLQHGKEGSSAVAAQSVDQGALAGSGRSACAARQQRDLDGSRRRHDASQGRFLDLPRQGVQHVEALLSLLARDGLLPPEGAARRDSRQHPPRQALLDLRTIFPSRWHGRLCDRHDRGRLSLGQHAAGCTLRREVENQRTNGTNLEYWLSKM